MATESRDDVTRTDRSGDDAPETAPCLSCGAETPLPKEVHSPVCFRPLCADCDGSDS
ncbi:MULTISPECIES: hypothetical protein [Saliphagus]|uniref:Small CPxCG-related zinc finger protein n=1 Tax=Saliphagus infecundisoli TaxID=1849069 RepID=A0ABD5QC12_9EURY|nr:MULTISPECIES: hypothetical protein [Saliphagus]